jgi:putative tryptophan/tyrosine transport system substrate-binding protein
MDTASASTTAHLVEAFRRGLSAAGYDEGRNVAIEYRWSAGDYDRLPALAAELVRRRVAVTAGWSRALAVRAQPHGVSLVSAAKLAFALGFGAPSQLRSQPKATRQEDVSR